MTAQQPMNTIDMINRLVRTSREMLRHIHREPTAEELAGKLTIPVDKVHRLLRLARTPFRLDRNA